MSLSSDRCWRKTKRGGPEMEGYQIWNEGIGVAQFEDMVEREINHVI